jgi:hypothetical protein
MRSFTIPTLAILASLLVGCAAIDAQDEPRQEKEYRTGSNLPQRDRNASPVTIVGSEGLQKMQTTSAVLPGGTAR